MDVGDLLGTCFKNTLVRVANEIDESQLQRGLGCEFSASIVGYGRILG